MNTIMTPCRTTPRIALAALTAVLLTAAPAPAQLQISADPRPGGTFTLTLEQATRLALTNNFDIQLAKYDTQIARTRQGEAESVYDAVLEAEFGYRNNQRRPTSTLAGTKSLANTYDLSVAKTLPSGTTVTVDAANKRDWSNSSFSTSNPSHDSSLGVSIEQALGRNFFGRMDRGDVEITRLDIQGVEFNTLFRIESNLAEVQRAYWDLVLAGEQVRIEQGLVEQARKFYEINVEQERHGLAERPDVLAAEANYQGQVNQLMLSENQRASRANVLRLLLNIPRDDVALEAVDRLPGPERAVDLTDSLAAAFAGRYDYQQLTTILKSKDIAVTLKQDRLWPEINLTASLTRNGVDDHFGPAFDQVISEDQADFFTGITFKVPLENNKARAQAQAAQLEKAQLLVSLKLLERRITLAVVDQVRTCQVLAEVAANARVVADLQSQKLAEEQNRFQLGRSDTDTVIRYQRDLLTASLAAAEAQYQYQLALVDLRRIEGRLLNDYWDGAI